MVLLDLVVQVFLWPQLRVSPDHILVGHFTDSPMGRGVAVERDAQRHLTLYLERFAQERLGRSHISLAAEPEVYGVSAAINRAIQVNPLAADIHIGLIHA